MGDFPKANDNKQTKQPPGSLDSARPFSFPHQQSLSFCTLHTCRLGFFHRGTARCKKCISLICDKYMDIIMRHRCFFSHDEVSRRGVNSFIQISLPQKLKGFESCTQEKNLYESNKKQLIPHINIPVPDKTSRQIRFCLALQERQVGMKGGRKFRRQRYEKRDFEFQGMNE